MPQPQMVEGHLINLDKDSCTDNELGKAFCRLGRPQDSAQHTT
jgi:hypothetical protein